MSVAALVRDDAVVVGDRSEVLGRIVEPQVHLALWRRALPDALSGLGSLHWDDIDDIDEIITVDTLQADVPPFIEAAGYAVLAPALAREIVTISKQFSAIMDCKVVRLRLEVVETDACRRFHADNVAARLLMPLVGPGTQWIYAGTDKDLQELRPGEIGVFKGRLWAEQALILHRSPPIAATGETRLLFALNPYVDGEMG